MTAPFRATYRLQLGTDLDFAAARALVPYLAELGVSHVYLSPSFQAREGSTHGYDVIDPGHVSDALGGEEGLRALADDAHAHGMGIILDVVPNHMAADDANRYWSDPALREQFFDVDPVSGRHRRFFDIDDLAGVRVEDPEVFAATHALALRLVAEGVVDGLRIDHPDGLADPAQYLRRLRDGGAAHVWVEKILDPAEELRPDWPVDGTVGYEFANDVAALFVDPAAEATLTELYASLTGETRPFEALAAEAKLEQATTTFAPEVERLRRLWPQVPGLEEGLASLPVYRTYVEPAEGRVEQADRDALAQADGLPDAVRHAVLLEDDAAGAGWSDLDEATRREFVVRFQQTTPPVMAKGVEDTAFYRYVRLLALNEVGGDPGRFGITVDAFHAANARRPVHNLLVSSTHDTKRSGDVRARLCALTAMPGEWAGAVRSWFEVNAPLRTAGAPTPAEELLIYQTLVGAWPIEAERLEDYLEKALREAKVTSNWIDPDLEHEAAVKAFAVGLLDHGPFRYGFDAVAARVAELGERVALAQTLLKLTVPGMPDVYQGDELWALSLVDPDNRRPVDWDARRAALAALGDGARPTHETAKLHVVAAALDLRRRRPEAFDGGYRVVPAGDDVVAFLRGDAVLAAVAVRDDATGAGGWELPPDAAGRWRDVLGGEEYELPDGATLAGVLGPDGRALLERVG
ncbi:malto-oligosyltrehalose synthase [Baekduia soli]|uniref:Malto-oligosyltrehalose synthase n=1 Tax=Baekduia soli TaxID=496014 RepID=A0A5B8U3P0_9ACTN|nr:malto-oligosyltrehalose synthase [Baekduia soli]QEC47610.1 malto-oligosyltrehalose synthase [Baekduia soli]